MNNELNKSDDFLKGYITLKEILKPNFSERKQNFLDLFINILSNQIKSYSSYLLSNKEILIQDNIFNLSKELSKLLIFIKEKEYNLLMFNNIINFTIKSSKRKFSNTKITNNNYQNQININKNITLQNKENNISLNKTIKSLNNNYIVNNINNNNTNNNNTLRVNRKDNFSIEKTIKIKKHPKLESEKLKNNSVLNYLTNSDDKKYKKMKLSLNNSTDKIRISTKENNKSEYRSKSNLKGKYNEIILINNEKLGIKAYEEFTKRPSNYAKYLVKKYKNVVDDYEKINFEKKKIKEFKKSKTLNKKK
jgi:hypothetical protein